MSEDQKPKGIAACKACGKDVAKSAKVCPHCGKKLKMGMMLKALLGIVAIIVVGALVSPSAEDELNELRNAQASGLSPRGELHDIFELNSDFTDLNRDQKEKEIKGQIVEWSLEVYEVKKSGDGYRVQTSGDDGFVGAFITFPKVSPEDAPSFENMRTGDFVSFKGKITGVFLRHIQIEPAILIQ
jgi:hypothetical protein